MPFLSYFVLSYTHKSFPSFLSPLPLTSLVLFNRFNGTLRDVIFRYLWSQFAGCQRHHHQHHCHCVHIVKQSRTCTPIIFIQLKAILDQSISRKIRKKESNNQSQGTYPLNFHLSVALNGTKSYFILSIINSRLTIAFIIIVSVVDIVVGHCNCHLMFVVFIFRTHTRYIRGVLEVRVYT